MKSLDLGEVETTISTKFLLIPLSKEWLAVNEGKSLVFEAKITKNGKLQLCAELSKLLQSCKEVDVIES